MAPGYVVKEVLERPGDDVEGRGKEDLGQILICNGCLFVCFHTRSPGAGIIGSQGESQGLMQIHRIKWILTFSSGG